ncbi:hypothetical protein BC938DRAFT_470814 [Jimgerdemannia flammicorona]|uniref:Glycoside hydrolase family 3 C-terminal domain-containing protein n=1 Tax=Jimgerdemannia flammicorona TaxID=994334 RepID=A0A433Q9C7_9FUNG|nr:hypothetical protein BC938DRAFT_470814 [Jimgerdemannia flammicorona]
MATPGNIHDITLAQGQIDLVTKVAAVNKKVVLVLTEGRPSRAQTSSPARYPGDQGLVYWRQVNNNINWQPLYEFGHDLSYSTFAYSNITVSSTTLTPKHSL